MSDSASLPFLLWNALRELESAYMEKGAGKSGMPSLDFWANLLRAIGDDGIGFQELPAALRLSKRAVKTRVGAAARRGWIEQAQLKRGNDQIRLTSFGASVADRWKVLESAAEQHWYAVMGTERARRLMSVLKSVVAAFPLEHPHYPAGYGAADASITGGNGRDWKPVPRENADTASNLPCAALISQSFVAFAMDYELLSPVALTLSTRIINWIPTDGSPLREFKDSVGVSALARHGFLRINVSHGCEIVFLTPKGKRVSELYQPRIREVESQWRTKFGDQRITALRRVLMAQTESVTNENGDLPLG